MSNKNNLKCTSPNKKAIFLVENTIEDGMGVFQSRMKLGGRQPVYVTKAFYKISAYMDEISDSGRGYNMKDGVSWFRNSALTDKEAKKLKSLYPAKTKKKAAKKKAAKKASSRK